MFDKFVTHDASLHQVDVYHKLNFLLPRTCDDLPHMPQFVTLGKCLSAVSALFLEFGLSDKKALRRRLHSEGLVNHCQSQSSHPQLRPDVTFSSEALGPLHAAEEGGGGEAAGASGVAEVAPAARRASDGVGTLYRPLGVHRRDVSEEAIFGTTEGVEGGAYTGAEENLRVRRAELFEFVVEE
jgi:hypothetical protein